jgi:hypothetical protein
MLAKRFEHQLAALQEPASSLRRNAYERLAAIAPPLLVAGGLLARLFSARGKFLNADEAMHYLLSIQPSLRATYNASLNTTHPPLFIIFLHYWGMISSNEFVLRLPSVLAGTAAGAFLYAWVRQVCGRATALIALSLYLFSPALIYTSAEVRQYALLLCFSSAALFLLERGLIRHSALWLLCSAIALYLALLTHYCALIFALSIAIYGLLRIISGKQNRTVVFTWSLTQAGFAFIAAWLWKTHISPIRRRSLTQDVAESYLRGSLFHPGQENFLAFIARANLRLFHFLFSEGAVSALGLVLFAAGIAILFRGCRSTACTETKTNRLLATGLLLPFVINCAAALAGVYPYGGTRHDSYLAIFAMPAVAVAIARWRPRSTPATVLLLALALAVCNFTVVPAGAYIRPKNQSIGLMASAVEYLQRSVPPGSIIVTDYESGLLLSYYVCHKDITHPGQPEGEFYYAQCGPYQTASLLPRLWVFRTTQLPAQLREVAARTSAGQQMWLFQAGFIVDREPELQALLAGHGAPQKFGANILICRISMSRGGKDWKFVQK